MVQINKLLFGIGSMNKLSCPLVGFLQNLVVLNLPKNLLDIQSSKRRSFQKEFLTKNGGKYILLSNFSVPDWIKIDFLWGFFACSFVVESSKSAKKFFKPRKMSPISSLLTDVCSFVAKMRATKRILLRPCKSSKSRRPSPALYERGYNSWKIACKEYICSKATPAVFWISAPLFW